MFKILDEKCTPTKGTEFSACVDLYAREDVVIGAGETVLVPLGISIDLKKLRKASDLELINRIGYKNAKHGDNSDRNLERFMKSHQLNLHIRSSMSAKHGLVIANGTGIIDLDYPGEIMICIQNPMIDKIERLKESFEKTDSDETGCGQFRDLAESILYGYKIKKGDKIAQISLVEHKTYLLSVESEEKRTGGFGSTNA